MAVKIFFCYAHEDEELLNNLKAHLKPLQWEGLIDIWYDRDISAGSEWEQEIHKHLNAAQIILLLVSSDFMNSDYCYGVEMQQALERHERGEALVVPVILRSGYWQIPPLRKLQALPTDAKPIMSASWQYPDEAFFDVTEGIRKAIEKMALRPPSLQSLPPELSQAKASRKAWGKQPEITAIDSHEPAPWTGKNIGFIITGKNFVQPTKPLVKLVKDSMEVIATKVVSSNTIIMGHFLIPATALVGDPWDVIVVYPDGTDTGQSGKGLFIVR